MKVAMIGHRPPQLWGYGYGDQHYTMLKEQIKAMLVQMGCTEAYCGMAIGADTIFAMAVLELRDMGYGITLNCVIPYRGYEGKWNETDRQWYNHITSVANSTVFIFEEYSDIATDMKNTELVKTCDNLMVVWNGKSHNSIGNAVMKANILNKGVVWINPANIG